MRCDSACQRSCPPKLGCPQCATSCSHLTGEQGFPRVLAYCAGPEADAQRVDEMAEGENAARRFFLQYYFPPSCVGEVGRVGSPGRREIGHGQLAERALMPVIPPGVGAGAGAYA